MAYDRGISGYPWRTHRGVKNGGGVVMLVCMYTYCRDNCTLEVVKSRQESSTEIIRDQAKTDEIR